MMISERIEELHQLLRTNVIVWADSYCKTNSPRSLEELKSALERLDRFEKTIPTAAENITFGIFPLPK